MIPARVKEVRQFLHLSQMEFARRMGLSKDVLGNIEYGRVQPKQVFLEHLCVVYNVRYQWLTTGEGEMFSARGAENLQKVTEAFRGLEPLLQEYALEQVLGLLKLQQEQEREKDAARGED